MGRTKSRSYSPPRRERTRSPAPRRVRRGDDSRRERGYRKFGRGRDVGRNQSPPTSLLVRNISRDSRPEDIRIPFERFGPVKDVYLPKDYYSGEPRGFGFVQYLDPGDASDAQYHMDRQVIEGREITVVFAEENRKKPSEMRVKDSSSSPTGRVGGYGGGGGRRGGASGGRFRRRSPPRSYGRRSRSRTRSHSPPFRRQASRERVARDSRERTHSLSRRDRHAPSGSRSHHPESPSPKKSASPDGNGQNSQGSGKSWSPSISPRARSPASRSASLD